MMQPHPRPTQADADQGLWDLNSCQLLWSSNQDARQARAILRSWATGPNAQSYSRVRFGGSPRWSEHWTRLRVPPIDLSLDVYVPHEPTSLRHVGRDLFDVSGLFIRI
jgi:hypothetical protein